MSSCVHKLSILYKRYNKINVRLYHNDGLAALKNRIGPHSEQVKKSIQKVFKEH